MAELSEFHKRRILVTFQHVERLLNHSVYALAQTRSGLQQRNIQDISSSKLHKIENHIGIIRNQMRGLLKRFQIDLPEPSTPSSWMLKTNITSVDMALEDLYPQKMRGYGEMDSMAADELTQTLKEIRKQVDQMLKELD
jgi:hypothetical protein